MLAPRIQANILLILYYNIEVILCHGQKPTTESGSHLPKALPPWAFRGSWRRALARSGKLFGVATTSPGEDKAMGNRDVRSREKKKPKKKEVKLTYQPAR